MTPRYVVMSYDLPPHIVDEVMQLHPKVNKRKPLSVVASQVNISLNELTERVRAASETHHGPTK